MKSLFTWITLPLLALSLQTRADDPPPPEGLPSPYFVDELHCSGIHVRDIREGWLLEADEVEPARKVDQAEMCNRLCDLRH